MQNVVKQRTSEQKILKHFQKLPISNIQIFKLLKLEKILTVPITSNFHGLTVFVHCDIAQIRICHYEE